MFRASTGDDYMVLYCLAFLLIWAAICSIIFMIDFEIVNDKKGI
jgi:hypothetical protein